MQRTRLLARSDASPLAGLAFAQHGVVAWRQLAALGLSGDQSCRLVAAGHLIRIHHGVYAVGHARLSIHGVWMAAVLSCGEGALLSHVDGLALNGVSRVSSGAVHVAAVGRHAHAGVLCHTSRHPEMLGATVRDGVPVTSLERAALDVAATWPQPRLRSMLEEIERQNRFDRGRFERLLAGCNGHRGAGRLAAALAELTDEVPWLASELEALFLALTRGGGVPDPGMNVIVAGHRVDAHWPEAGVVAEIDSWRYHRGHRSFEEDRRRSNAFALAGLIPLRFTDTRIRDEPHAVLAEVRAALRRPRRG